MIPLRKVVGQMAPDPGSPTYKHDAKHPYHIGLAFGEQTIIIQKGFESFASALKAAETLDLKIILDPAMRRFLMEPTFDRDAMIEYIRKYDRMGLIDEEFRALLKEPARWPDYNLLDRKRWSNIL